MNTNIQNFNTNIQNTNTNFQNIDNKIQNINKISFTIKRCFCFTSKYLDLEIKRYDINNFSRSIILHSMNYFCILTLCLLINVMEVYKTYSIFGEIYIVKVYNIIKSYYIVSCVFIPIFGILSFALLKGKYLNFLIYTEKVYSLYIISYIISCFVCLIYAIMFWSQFQFEAVFGFIFYQIVFIFIAFLKILFLMLFGNLMISFIIIVKKELAQVAYSNTKQNIQQSPDVLEVVNLETNKNNNENNNENINTNVGTNMIRREDNKI